MSLSGIRRAMAGLRHDYFGKVYVSALKAFIDDSGSGGDSPWYVLAGYIGTVEAWDRFDKPWQKILNGPPNLEYFKASEAESLRTDGQWAGVSKYRRNQRINSLIRVIGNCAIRSTYVRVRQQDYNEVIKPYIPDCWDSAYYWLFPAIISSVTSIEKYMGSSRPVELIFDTAGRLEEPSKQLYAQIADRQQFRNRVVNVHYEDEKEFLPLQAADLLAWQIRRRFSVREPPRIQFKRALNCPTEKPFTHTITRERLEELGEDLDQYHMAKWAEMGYPEYLRKCRRPPRK